MPLASRSCVRCGAPIRRGRGLRAARFTADLGERLQADFNRYCFNLCDRDERAAVAVGWTGFGSSVALLITLGGTLALEALLLQPENGPGAAGLIRRRLASGLPTSLADSLVAPPLAGAAATYLVSDAECRIFPHEEQHRGATRGAESWSASVEGEQICAAAMTADGELFLATTDPKKPDASLVIRSAEGAFLTRLEGMGVSDGEGVGFAVQRTGVFASASLHDDLAFYAWRDGKLSRHRLADGPGSTRTFDMPGLTAPPRSWARRVRAEVPVPWMDWRCAASGVYPVETAGEQPLLVGLKLDGDPPVLVPYGRGRFHTVISGLSEVTLLIDALGLQLVDSHSGDTRARQEGAPGRNNIFAGMSAGTFVRLSSDRADEVIMSGLVVKAGNLENGFRAVLRRSGSRAGTATHLLRPDLPPIETDDGLLLGFEEGAGSEAKLLLWHATRAMQPEASR